MPNIVASILITSRYFGARFAVAAPRRLRLGRRHDRLPKALELLDLLQIGHFHLAQIVQRQKAGMDQNVGLLGGQARDRRQILHRLGDLLLKAQRDHRFRLDVNLPAGQLGSQPGVLAALADGQGKLVLRHRDLHPPARLHPR